MHITDEVSRDIVHHDPLVEGVEAEKAILPTLRFASDVMGVQAAEFEYWGGVLCGWNGQVRSTSDGCRGHSRILD